MIYTLRVSTLALLDIEDAIFWYELHQKGLGGSLKDKLFECLEYISQYPLHCEKKYKDVRVKYIERFPYGIHYLVVDDEVRVIAFFHTRLDPKKWTRRLKSG